MKVAFTGRNLVVTPAIEEFTRERLEKLVRWLDDLSEAHVILAKEKYRHIAEVVVKGKNVVLSGSQETEDMYSSIGKVLEKIEHQAKKHREKIVQGKRRRSGRKNSGDVESDAVAEELIVATLPDGMHVVRDEDFPHKPMTLEEAALQLDEDERTFLVFRDAGNQRIGVLYERGDGNLGLIQPQG
jgi:ribosome hibernation promoting factor